MYFYGMYRLFHTLLLTLAWQTKIAIVLLFDYLNSYLIDKITIFYSYYVLRYIIHI